MNIKNRFQFSWLRIGPDEPLDLNSWRKWLVNVVIFFAAFAIPLAMLVTFPVFIAGKHYGLIAFDVIIWLLAIIGIFNKASTYQVRAYFFLAILYTMTITFFIALGPHHARSGWLVMCSVMVAVMFGVHAATVSATINAAVLMLLYWLMGPENQAWTAEYAAPFSKWVMFVANISSITLVSSLPVGFLLNRLDRSLKSERETSEKLSVESEKLQTAYIALQDEIKERKQNEEMLKESQRYVRGLFEASLDPLVTIALDGKIADVNSAAVKLTGVTREELIGSDSFDYFTEPEKARAGAKQVFEEGFARNYPLEIRHKNGKTTPVLFNASVYKDEQGNVIGVLAAARDVTELNRAEEEIRRLSIAVKQSIDGVAMSDLETKLTYVNEAFAGMHGYSPEEMIGIKVVNLHKEEDTDKFSIRINKLKREGSWIGEIEHIRKDGTTFPTVTSSTLLKDAGGKPSGILGIVRDITDQKRSEVALWKSEAKFRDLVENIDEIIYTLDKSGQITYISPAIESKSGYKRQELIGRSFGEFVYHEDLPRIMEEFPKNLSGHLEPSEYRLVAKSGEVYWIRASSRPVYEADRVVGLRGVIADITESKQLQAQLLQSQKMESIGTLAGGVAHDFNNILYLITGNAELALEDIPEWNPAHANLKDIKAAGLRAAGIVKQLLNFSRKADHESKPIGVITVIKDVLKFLRSTIPSTVEIRKHLPDTDVTIFADPVQITQVLMNICTNASQAMEETGGILEITVGNVALDEKSSDSFPDLSRGDYIQVTVRDTGPGINSEIIDRIFDPYFTTKEVGKGSGMGLAMVHGIVKNHGGAITVDSETGKGAVFTMLFPVVTEKTVMEVETPDEIPLGTEAILFIDDEESIANMTGQSLVRLGYTVETRTNPVEALELFKSKPDQFDLVITDMTMPQMTGARLSEKLKEIRSDIPVIICTGHSSLIDEEKAKEMGIAAYVMKPILKSDIAKIIRKVLDNKINAAAF